MKRTTRNWAVALVLAMLVGACGGETTTEDGPDPTGAAETPDEATTGTENDGSAEPDPTPTTGATGDAEPPAATGSGTATLTIGDMTYEFSGLTCYYDADAAEVYGDDDTTFLALVMDGDAAFFVLVRDMGIELFEVAYISGGSDSWHMGYTDTENDINPVYNIENGVVTVEGADFDLIVNNEETDTTETGTVQANCG